MGKNRKRRRLSAKRALFTAILLLWPYPMSVLARSEGVSSPEARADLHPLILPGYVRIIPPAFSTDLFSYYGRHLMVLGIGIIVLLILVIAVLYNTSLKIKMQNDRLLQLENLTDEYIYEYSFQGDRLHLSAKCRDLFRYIGPLKKLKVMPIEGDIIISEQDSEVRKFLESLLFSEQDIQEKSLHFTDGTSTFFKVVKSTLRSKNGTPVYIIGKLVDISMDKAEKDMLLEIAKLDMMTQLLNAQCCKADICEALWNLKDKETGYLYLMDIDNFKKINDTYGHVIGDQIITAVAKSLEQCFHGPDILGRVGGDEFCAYSASVHSSEEAKERYQKLLTALNTPGSLTREHQITISMGIVPITRGQTFETAYKLADQALYEVKWNGKGHCRLIFKEAEDTVSGTE